MTDTKRIVRADLNEIVEAVMEEMFEPAIEGFSKTFQSHQKQNIRKALERFVQPDGWISVEDRLPERNENVLILRDKPFSKYHVTAFQRDGVFISNETAKELIKVTHWMPLPTTPKKGGEDEG